MSPPAGGSVSVPPPAEGGKAIVTLINPEDAGAVAPGQACVAYDGDTMLGGGWIAASTRD